jgi:excisionase family DNA binding protein
MKEPTVIDETPQRGLKRGGGRKPGNQTSKTKRPLPDQPIITYDKLESAQMLKVSVRQLDKYIDDGELPVSRMNARSVRILREDLLAFLRSRQTNREPRGGRCS